MIYFKYINLIRLLRNERRSIDELTHLQNIALKRLVYHAYETVPFYKELFDEVKLYPEDIVSIEDLSRIPIVDKQIFKQHPYNHLISCKYDIKNLLTIRTAGSNGTPYMFYIDRSFDNYRKAQFIRPYLSNGKRLSDRTAYFSVYKESRRKWYQHLNIMPETRIYSGMEIQNQIKTIQDIEPEIIQGYGSILNLLAVKILNENLPVPKPRLIFTDSELLLPTMRENIERAFSAKIIDIYGTWETDNIAYECTHHKGYHLAVDSIILEFVKDGRPVQPGEEGEAVVTILNNFGMPFIRYNLHDIGSYYTNSCSCGRTFPLINQIKGRSNDYLITEEGKKFSVFNLGPFSTLAPHASEYQLIQENFNFFTLLIVPNTSYTNQADLIVPEIKKFFPDAQINIKLVASIPREPSGKFKSFKSKVNK